MPKVHRVEPDEPEPLNGSARRWEYADAFEIAVAEPRTAEQWARATLEQGPIALRVFVETGWRFVLRLRLGSNHSDDHVAGWPIVLRTPEAVVLEVESGALGHARLTFRTRPDVAGAATNVAFERRGSHALWSVAGLLHRRVLPYLLGRAGSAPPPP